MRNLYLLILVSIVIGFLGSPMSALGEEMDEKTCLSLAEAAPDPAPVKLEELLQTMELLKSTKGEPLLVPRSEWEKEVRRIFDLKEVKTKTEQFYRLLHVIAMNMKPSFPGILQVDPVPVRKTLLVSTVFLDSDIPDQIREVEIDRTMKKQPRYAVRFASPETKMPLNGEKGFYAFTHGFCQRTTALMFYDQFSFKLKLLKNGNIRAQYFKGVDFFGSFGTRGMVDIDFQYVAIRSVEFYRGEKEGEVVAAISRKEFAKNEHNSLLSFITKFVKNSSVQSLGW